VGPRFELFAAGPYTLLPLDQIESVTMLPPPRLRDLLWSPAVVRTGPRFEGLELGEVLLPVLSPESADDSDDAVRLGRVTEWVALDGVEVPIGQRLLLVDGEEFPILELRELRIDQPSEAGA
jgi:type VI secretion system protein ImpE